MKIKRFLITGLILSVLGGGIAACASMRKDFELEKVFEDPTLEEKKLSLDKVTTIHFEGPVEYLVLKEAEESKVTYYEGKNRQYQLEYHQDTGVLEVAVSYQKKYFVDAVNHQPFTIELANTLEEANIDISTGKVTIENIEIRQLTCNINVGDMEIKNTNLGIFEGVVHTGDIRYSGRIQQSLDAQVNCGYIELNLENTASECTINQTLEQYIPIYYHTNVGDSQINFKESE